MPIIMLVNFKELKQLLDMFHFNSHSEANKTPGWSIEFFRSQDMMLGDKLFYQLPHNQRCYCLVTDSFSHGQIPAAQPIEVVKPDTPPALPIEVGQPKFHPLCPPR